VTSLKIFTRGYTVAFVMDAVIPTCRIQLLKDPISDDEATMNNSFSAEYRHVTLFSSISVKIQKSVLHTALYKRTQSLEEKSMQISGTGLNSQQI
jgi:hypothetical protein